MNERYRPVKIYMTATIEVLVMDSETQEEQEQKMTDQAINFVQCLGASEVDFEMAEFNDYLQTKENPCLSLLQV